MIYFALAFSIGVAALLLQSELPPLALVAVGAFALPLLFINSVLARTISAAAIGFSWALLVAQHSLDKTLPETYESTDLAITGVIAAMPEIRGENTRFVVDVEHFDIRDKDVVENVNTPIRVRLSWFHAPALNAGERWQLSARLKRPNGFMNPGGFDYEAWLFRQGIRATGYVKKNDENRRLSASNGGIENWRQSIRDQIRTMLPDSTQTPVLIALAIGDQRGISEGAWQVFTRTGTNHLVAVSGLHITMVTGLAFFIFRFIWSRLGNLPLHVPAPKAAALLSLFPAITYAALAGFSVPTQRAMIMTTVIMISLFVTRKHRPFDVLAIAWIAVLFSDPFALFAAGFWLSFVAVGVLFYAMLARTSQRGWWWKFGQPQMVVAFGLMPVMIILFQQVPIIAPIANIVAIPWVSLVVTPMTLLGASLVHVMPTFAFVFLKVATYAMDVIWYFLRWLAHDVPVLWQQSVPAIWTLSFAIVGVLWLLLPRGVPARWLGVVLCLPMLMYKPPVPNDGEAWVTVLDAGEGLAAVVRTRDHVMVYDTGPRFSDTFDSGEAVVVPYIRFLGASEIDMLMISHGDLDHRGGVESILNGLPVKQLVSSVNNPLPRAPDQRCDAGLQWTWDGVRFEVLHPYANENGKDNNLSCVLRVETSASSFLLTGDIEKLAEQKLIERYGAKLHAELMLVPHHGSKTSSHQEFIDTVNPRVAVAATGYRNRFGFPKPEIVERYIRHGISFYNTATTGALTFRLNQRDGFTVEPYRENVKHFWHTL